MNDLSVKGIAIGLIVYFVLSVPVGYFASSHVLEIYEDLGFPPNAVESEAANIKTVELIAHPKYVPLVILMVLATTGVASVVAARTSNRAFVKNAVAFGFVVVLVATLLSGPLQFDPVALALRSLDVGVAYLGGLFCVWWVKLVAKR